MGVPPLVLPEYGPWNRHGKDLTRETGTRLRRACDRTRSEQRTRALHRVAGTKTSVAAVVTTLRCRWPGGGHGHHGRTRQRSDRWRRESGHRLGSEERSDGQARDRVYDVGPHPCRSDTCPSTGGRPDPSPAPVPSRLRPGTQDETRRGVDPASPASRPHRHETESVRSMDGVIPSPVLRHRVTRLLYRLPTPPLLDGPGVPSVLPPSPDSSGAVVRRFDNVCSYLCRPHRPSFVAGSVTITVKVPSYLRTFTGLDPGPTQ